MAHKTDNEGVEYFDITTFLWHTRCFAILSRPFLAAFRFLKLLIGWHYPKLTFTVWLLLSLLSSLIPTGYTVILFVVFLGISCCFGLLHHHTQIFIKLFPDQELEASALQNYLQRSWGEEQKILDEYRNVLMQLDKIIELLNSYLEVIYRLLKWERPFVSFGVIIMILLTSVLLSVADLKTMFFIINNVIFLGNGIYLRIETIKNIKALRLSRKASFTNPDSAEVLTTNKVAENKIETEDFDPDDAEIVDADDMEIYSSATKISNETTIDGNNSNVIQKLLDLRKRHHQNLSGVCSACHASLMTILRRKYWCCNCGNQFCWKCCNHKVPRSFLGVTAPATKNDTILLCASCHRQLHDKNN